MTRSPRETILDRLPAACASLDKQGHPAWMNLAWPLGMALFDTEGQYARVNDALCRLLGRSRDEVIGRRDQEFTHPEDRQRTLTRRGGS